jgi:serine/threonine protein phosphatase PrpC
MQRQKEDHAKLTFKDQFGRPINDPRPGMKRLPTSPIDYQIEQAITQTYITELWGRRSTQEDSFAVNEFKGLANLSSLGVMNALTNTIDSLSNSIKEKNLADGSTLCVTVLCGNQIYNANVGDSESFLVIKDKDNNIVSFERLNKIIHDINDANVAQLKQQGLKINTSLLYRNDHRLPYPTGEDGVNMYRAMGDLIFEQAGMSHKADISLREVYIPEGGNAFVINACDGLTETMTHDDVKKILSQHKSASLDQIPQLLAKAAYHSGSQDNISVLVTPVIPHSPPKFLAIFDGHGGTSVSHFLGDNFDAAFVKQYFEEFQSELLGAHDLAKSQNKIQNIFQLKDRIIKLSPDGGWAEKFAELTSAHHARLEQENDKETRSQLHLAHLALLEQLLGSIRHALMVTSNMTLQLPSSFSPQFKDHKTNPKIKDAIALSEANAKAALIAFIYIPNDGNQEENFKKLLNDLNTTISQSVDMINQAAYETESQLTQDFISQIIKQLEGKPYYQNATDELKTMKLQLEEGVYAAHRNLDHILFSIYLDTCKLNADTGLFSRLNTNKEMLTWLEKILIERHPAIITTAPHTGISTSQQTRILCYAADTDSELADTLKLELQTQKKHGLSSPPNENDKKTFIRTAELLSQLGQAGFAACSEFFKLSKNKSVTKNEFATYYDNEIAARSKALSRLAK